MQDKKLVRMIENTPGHKKKIRQMLDEMDTELAAILGGHYAFLYHVAGATKKDSKKQVIIKARNLLDEVVSGRFKGKCYVDAKTPLDYIG